MGQERRYVSTDPNFGTDVAETPRKYISTDPNFGAPLRVATKGENLPAPDPTWADQLGLNTPTDSMLVGFLRGAGTGAVDLAQGAVATIANRMQEKRAIEQHGVETFRRAAAGDAEALREEMPEQAPAMQAPDSMSGTIGGLLPTVAEMAVPIGAGVKAGVNALPSAVRAGEKFQDVMGAARNIPIETKAVGDVALRIQQMADRGGSMPMAVRKLLLRMTDPNKAPMVYEESRDFASNISRLSVNEFKRMNPAVAREVANLRVAINEANAHAAQLAGKGAEYKLAMREYAQAMRLRDAIDSAVSGLKKAAPAATVGGAAYWMTGKVIAALQGMD